MDQVAQSTQKSAVGDASWRVFARTFVGAFFGAVIVRISDGLLFGTVVLQHGSDSVLFDAVASLGFVLPFIVTAFGLAPALVVRQTSGA